jgi:hypothetical protein
LSGGEHNTKADNLPPDGYSDRSASGSQAPYPTFIRYVIQHKNFITKIRLHRSALMPIFNPCRIFPEMKPIILSFPNTASVWFFLQLASTKKVQVEGTTVLGSFTIEDVELARKQFKATVENKKRITLTFKRA